MSGFIDEYLPDEIPGYPCISVPRTKTSIQVNWGGKERRNQEWDHPLHRFLLPEAVARDWVHIEVLKKHWLIMGGPAATWPFRDPLDFASCDLDAPNRVPNYTMLDQLIGTATGFTDRFQLVKEYEVGSNTYSRTIHLPVEGTVLVAHNGILVPDTDYTVSRPGGEILFDVPPPLGGSGEIRAGFLFDNEVRYENDDTLESLVRTFEIGGFSDISLTEVRPC